MKTLKKKYIRLKTEKLDYVMETPILTGSVTVMPIQIGSVEVKDFEPGFNDEFGNDFKDITFD